MHENKAKIPDSIQKELRAKRTQLEKEYFKYIKLQVELNNVTKKIKQVTNRPQDSPGGNRA